MLQSTVTQTVMKNQTVYSPTNYTLFTVTQQGVLVVLYTPTCVTSSNSTTVEFVEENAGESTTVTYIYPQIPHDASFISITTVTNNTDIASDRTQFESVHC